MTEGIIETTGLDADTVNAWMTSVWGEGSVQAAAGTLGGAFDPTSDYFTKRAWRAARYSAALRRSISHGSTRRWPFAPARRTRAAAGCATP